MGQPPRGQKRLGKSSAASGAVSIQSKAGARHGSKRHRPALLTPIADATPRATSKRKTAERFSPSLTPLVFTGFSCRNNYYRLQPVLSGFLRCPPVSRRLNNKKLAHAVSRTGGWGWMDKVLSVTRMTCVKRLVLTCMDVCTMCYAVVRSALFA